MKLQNPMTTAISCLCKTELNLFTRNAPRRKKSNKLARQRKLYLDCDEIGKRKLASEAETMKAQVILYSKPGCDLCEEMKAEIAKADCPDLYDFEEINIET